MARRLGISTRTFRRRLADLMRQLGATNRFQAGAHAAHAGLLPPTTSNRASAEVSPALVMGLSRRETDLERSA